jgi:hypothetical protein
MMRTYDDWKLAPPEHDEVRGDACPVCGRCDLVGDGPCGTECERVLMQEEDHGER